MDPPTVRSWLDTSRSHFHLRQMRQKSLAVHRTTHQSYEVIRGGKRGVLLVEMLSMQDGQYCRRLLFGWNKRSKVEVSLVRQRWMDEDDKRMEKGDIRPVGIEFERRIGEVEEGGSVGRGWTQGET